MTTHPLATVPVTVFGVRDERCRIPTYPMMLRQAVALGEYLESKDTQVQVITLPAGTMVQRPAGMITSS